MIGRLRTGALVALALALAPQVAFACPACAGREPGSSNATWLLLAGMIGVPYLVGTVVFRVIRAIERGDKAAQIATPGEAAR